MFKRDMAALKNYWRRLSAGSAWGPSTGPGPPTEEMSSQDSDILFAWQLGGEEFERLNADSLLKVGVCDNKYYANRLLRACHSAGIINATTGQPDTSKVDRNIVNKIAIIGISKQRKLVNMLFYWEEELVRWRILCEEENELAERLNTEPDLGENERVHLEEALKITRARKRVLPSLRDRSGSVQLTAADLPPQYQAREH